jgi:hypothetical protein
VASELPLKVVKQRDGQHFNVVMGSPFYYE